ncbi:dicarboxylate/amino acid:cation symporter [Maricaulis sp.]|uniref:dicarboxylate/amino acid:cation symporter n=1 Tax=Maricaulis sp. TaxID=1486257 RepID=UPI00260C1A58|nr:dicarboxylate/amino acid:cation symporter [Maricaulis sp.]
MSWWFKIKLWQRVLVALILGVVFGLLISNTMGEAGAVWLETWVRPVGALFIDLIRMLIVPLIMFTLVSGVIAMGDPARLGSLGAKTLILYLATTFFANIIGLIVGTIMRPGEGIDFGTTDPAPVPDASGGIFDAILTALGTFLNIVPDNIVAALADGDVLAIILVALLIGAAVLATRSEGASFGAFFESGSSVFLKITHWVMEIAPFGVFALVSHTVATQGLETLQAILTLIGAVYLGLIIHMVITYGFLVRFVLNLPLIRFFRGILDAQAVAYSTASSSATLPVTITNATDNLGIKKPVAGSVLPLGATINMDGTALYLGILALFTAQAFGYELTLANYILIAVTAAAVSIGAAGIPSASLFLLATVLNTFGVSVEHQALILGLILPVDRIMDMARTAVNVTGDAAVATAVAKWEGELDEETFKTPAVI